MSTYDTLGRRYSRRRKPDPRIAAALRTALGDARTVLNVGAGPGSYEPTDRPVVAVEPSSLMIAQRPAGSAPVVQAYAESLPFADRSFDAVLAILTVHHWADQRRGLSECARVARQRVVLLTWSPAAEGFWLVQDYFPELMALDRRRFPGMDDFKSALGDLTVLPLPVPHDCVDGFLGAYWRRPEAYLDAEVRSAMSGFGAPASVEGPLGRLRSDLSSGEWRRRHGELMSRAELDMGYCIVVAEVPP